MAALTVSDALRAEFESYYVPGEVPRDWVDDIPALARDSAERLREDLEPGTATDMVRLLREMQVERRHPMNVVIERQSAFDLFGRDEQWRGYQQLLGAIARLLAP